MNISTHKHTLNITKSPITLQKCGFNKKKKKKRQRSGNQDIFTMRKHYQQVWDKSQIMLSRKKILFITRKGRRKKKRYGRVYILLSAQSSSLRTPALC